MGGRHKIASSAQRSVTAKGAKRGVSIISIHSHSHAKSIQCNADTAVTSTSTPLHHSPMHDCNFSTSLQTRRAHTAAPEAASRSVSGSSGAQRGAFIGGGVSYVKTGLRAVGSLPTGCTHVSGTHVNSAHASSVHASSAHVSTPPMFRAVSGSASIGVSISASMSASMGASFALTSGTNISLFSDHASTGACVNSSITTLMGVV
jgi:hypothetical protein